jgi:hypothetical protein
MLCAFRVVVLHSISTDLLSICASAGAGSGPEDGAEGDREDHAVDYAAEGDEDDHDDGLPPLEANTNRKVIVHYVSDSEDDEDEDE